MTPYTFHSDNKASYGLVTLLPTGGPAQHPLVTLQQGEVRGGWMGHDDTKAVKEMRWEGGSGCQPTINAMQCSALRI